MKARDLIRELSCLSPEAEVLVDGYESGYDEPNLTRATASYRGVDSELPEVFGVWRDEWLTGSEVWVLSRSKNHSGSLSS